ncbi:hypothetical protein AYO20_09921 [Fonsecaea nubica]|uniref:Major facilitator superfamily (MFS) profile domain-containing protein n=1 Tax=Fonsecaea nubica TaxID=856822 RepID=A0A178CA93_9EURO|nr:hypothetical protein AYO20_09921 [Fonsecaea nubica]OAL26888.1 hypothetical protein AYO20_09921 [Fonsecaea nubica]
MLRNLQGRSLSAGISLACGFAFLLFGYDQGLMGGLLSNPRFVETFKNPNPTIQGQIVSTYYLGCIVGAFISIFVGDTFGRRRAIMLACTLVVIGGTIQASSYSLGQLFPGRVIAGMGTGMNTTAIPMWQSETSKAKHRGKMIVLQLTLVLSGVVVVSWMNYGLSFADATSVSWRFPIAFQNFFALASIALTFLMPESPRWLCLKDRNDEARTVIARLAAAPPESLEVSEAMALILEQLQREREFTGSRWKEVFTNGKQQNFYRICLGGGCFVMQQMGGINVSASYLPVVLMRAFNFSDRMALVLAAVASMTMVLWGALGALLIDRYGRVKLMLIGAAGMGICYVFVAAGLSQNTKGWNAVAVLFLFMYYIPYGLMFVSIPYIYPSEINSQVMRNTGTAIAMVVNWLFVYIIVLITPDSLANIGWRFFIIFAVLNVSFVPFIWYFYIETAKLSLEEIDRMFEIYYDSGKKITFAEAALRAKEESAEIVRQVAERTNKPEGVEFVQVEKTMA